MAVVRTLFAKGKFEPWPGADEDFKAEFDVSEDSLQRAREYLTEIPVPTFPDPETWDTMLSLYRRLGRQQDIYTGEEGC